MTERFTGSDAFMWHMERPDSPMHTLKIAILDPGRRGRTLTLPELATAVGSRLGLVPRSTQKVVAARGFGGRPYWVDDPDFSLADHLDEVTLPAPGSMQQFDRLCARLAEQALPRHISPWSMTLVHGLAGGRQAVIVCVHHAVTDGLGALNAFLATTSDRPKDSAPITPPVVAETIDRRTLGSRARREVFPFLAGLPRLLVDATASRHRAHRYRREHPDLPPFFGATRCSLHAASGPARVCATGTLPLARVRAVGRATGCTVNGVLHALIAGAVRAELTARGERVDRPTVATFGIAVDRSSTRRSGNQITPTNVALASHVHDPLDRLRETARSCREGVEFRQITGLDMSGRWAEYGPRVIAALRSAFAPRKRVVANHLVTANVPGPPTTRWAGGVEIVDWFSFAVALNPSNVNLTVYSFDGRLNLGLVATPAAMADPHGFLARLSEELDILEAVIGTRVGTLAGA